MVFQRYYEKGLVIFQLYDTPQTLRLPYHYRFSFDKNIDDAWKQRNIREWNVELKDDDFNNFILPHRIGDENCQTGVIFICRITEFFLILFILKGMTFLRQRKSFTKSWKKRISNIIYVQYGLTEKPLTSS